MYLGRVYAIENKLNKNKYIGQTTKKLSTRLCEHKSEMKRPKNQNIKLYVAFREYGLDQFEIYCLETFVELDEKELRKKMDDYESQCIAKYDTVANGYNSTSGGTNCKYSDETKERMRTSHSNTSLSVDAYTMGGDFIKTYNSVKEASRDLQARASTIKNCVYQKVRTKSANGYRFTLRGQPLIAYKGEQL